jgi:hypothetical protein
MYNQSGFPYELAGRWTISTANYEDHESTVTAHLKPLPCYSLYWIKESHEISTQYSHFLLIFEPYARPKDHEVVESLGP